MIPKQLQPGDTIGIISPSWGGAGLFPHRVEMGLNQLKQLGFNVTLANNALNHMNYVSDTPENRAADIHQMFSDPDVKAIIAAIGGDHSCHLLPLLDFELIQDNPKIFMGFSDITVLNVAIWVKTGLVTFNGPALLTDFAEYPHMQLYTQQAFQKTLCKSGKKITFSPADEWTEEFLDWEQRLDLQRPRKMIQSMGWTWLRHGSAHGILVGGCIESLQHLRGTPFWPGWDEAILFFETSEEKPSPATIDGILMDYENMGIFQKLRGLLVGRPIYYSDQEKEALRSVILERTRKYNFPIITDMDFGHTSPQLILPVGGHAQIDTTQNLFEILLD